MATATLAMLGLDSETRLLPLDKCRRLVRTPGGMREIADNLEAVYKRLRPIAEMIDRGEGEELGLLRARMDEQIAAANRRTELVRQALDASEMGTVPVEQGACRSSRMSTTVDTPLRAAFRRDGRPPTGVTA